MQEILKIFFNKVMFGIFLLFGSFRFLISEDWLKKSTKNSKIWFCLLF